MLGVAVPMMSGMRPLALLFSAGAVTISVLASTRFSREIASLLRHVPGGDTLGHFLIMGVVAFFVALGFATARFRGRTLGIVGTASIVAAVVTVDELIQVVVPSRTFSLTDLSANYAGILSFSWLAWVVRGSVSAEPER